MVIAESRADFDRWLWPHVQRKASLILEMASATEPLRKPYSGPIVPARTACIVRSGASSNEAFRRLR